jgi:hypothetical protein
LEKETPKDFWTNSSVVFYPKSQSDLEKDQSMRESGQLGEMVVFTRGSETGVGETTARRALVTASVLPSGVSATDLYDVSRNKSDQSVSDRTQRNGLLALGGKGVIDDARVQDALKALRSNALYRRGDASSGTEKSQTRQNGT